VINIDIKSEIQEKMKYGFIDVLILLLLKEEDMYGYQIVQEIENRSNSKLSIKEGSLYGPLYRLENKGFVSVNKKLVGKRRFRNYYHLETLGLEYLNISLKSFNDLKDGIDAIENWKGKENE